MHIILIMLALIGLSGLPFVTGHLHANQLNDETGAQKKYKPRDSAPYKSLASILKTAHKKASSAKFSSLQKKKSSTASIKKSKRIAADKKKRLLKSASRHKTLSGRISASKTGEHKNLTHRVSKHSNKTLRHKHSYSGKYSSKSKNLHRNGLNRKKATAGTKSVSR